MRWNCLFKNMKLMKCGVLQVHSSPCSGIWFNQKEDECDCQVTKRYARHESYSIDRDGENWMCRNNDNTNNNFGMCVLRDFDNIIIINSLFRQNREWRVPYRNMCVFLLTSDLCCRWICDVSERSRDSCVGSTGLWSKRRYPWSRQWVCRGI